MAMVRGINHVAVVTSDVERCARFWCDLLEAELVALDTAPSGRIAIIRIADDGASLNVFEVADNVHAAGLRDMFARGHIDHLGFTAADSDAFWALRDQALAGGWSSGDVTDFGPAIGFELVDPDGMTAEIDLVIDPRLAGSHPPVPYIDDCPTAPPSRAALPPATTEQNSATWAMESDRRLTKTPKREDR